MVKIEDEDVREVKEKIKMPFGSEGLKMMMPYGGEGMKVKMSYGGEGKKMKTCWRVRGVDYE
jgi:hypothetical protein